MSTVFGALARWWSRAVLYHCGDDLAARVAEVEAIRDAALADAPAIAEQAARLAAASMVTGALARSSARRTDDRAPGGQRVPEPEGT